MIRCVLAALILCCTALAARAAERPNVLLITADDMNYDTPNAAGGKTPGVTPHIDRLAGEGLRFVHSHVTVAVCQPSRECLMTGRYPHRNGAVGFYPVNKDVPTLMESLKGAGYQLGILGKVVHLRPAAKFPWDFQHDAGDLGHGRDPAKYHRYVKEFLDGSKAAGKPFFLMANSHDPHRPFAGSAAEKNIRGDYPPPDRTFRPEEVTVPGFLPDLPNVRAEVAQYFSSARRCDQTVGEVLRALKESGLEENTLVMFLSDNGMSMPFAKSNCYLTSTRTPWLVRWPGHVKPGTVDDRHMVSGIDFMPTVLDALGLSAPPGMDGRSFLPVLRGEPQDGRDRVFTCYNETSAGNAYPMRCVHTRQYGYVYNAWSDGKTAYRSEPMNGIAFAAMKAAAPNRSDVAGRVELLVHRVPEELYDLQADPDALHNLIGDPAQRERVRELRAELLAWMEKTGDPLRAGYRKVVENK
jgi:N-sulfoglucosamine sulfohydrolase